MFKKLFLTLSLLAAGAGLASAEGVDITFADNKAPENVEFGSTTAVTFADGHATATLTLQANNNKYRNDIKYNANFTLGADQFIAIKFIGQKPQGQGGVMKLNIVGNPALKEWGKPTSSIETAAGNYIYYYGPVKNNFSDNTTTATEVACTKLEFKIADYPAEETYTVDWIKTFNSVEAIEADRNVKDDGEDDMDDAYGVSIANVTYDDLAKAVEAAVDGDVLVVNQPLTVSSRITFAKNLTIKALNENAIISCGSYNGSMLLVNGGKTVTFENMVFDGTNCRTDKSLFESTAGSTILNLTGVTFRNFAMNNQVIITAKSSGKTNIKDCKFENCSNSGISAGVVFFGTNGSTIEGNNANLSFNIEKSVNMSVNGTLTNTEPITIYCTEGRVYTAAIVNNYTDVSKFKAGNAGKVLVAKEGKIYMEDAPAMSMNLGNAAFEATGNDGKTAISMNIECSSELAEAVVANSSLMTVTFNPDFTVYAVADDGKTITDTPMTSEELSKYLPTATFTAAEGGLAMNVATTMAGRYTMKAAFNGNDTYKAVDLGEKTITVKPTVASVGLAIRTYADEAKNWEAQNVPFTWDGTSFKPEKNTIYGVDPAKVQIVATATPWQSLTLYYKVTPKNVANSNALLFAAPDGFTEYKGSIDLSRYDITDFQIEQNGVMGEPVGVITSDVTTAVDEIDAEDAEEEAIYFDLNGIRVLEPKNGIYVKVQNNTAKITVVD